MWENLVGMWMIIIRLQACGTEIVQFCGNSVNKSKIKCGSKAILSLLEKFCPMHIHACTVNSIASRSVISHGYGK